MPLLKGSSDDIVRQNFQELRSTGKYSEPQCWAIAMKTAGKTKAADRAKKGVIAKPRNNMKVK